MVHDTINTAVQSVKRSTMRVSDTVSLEQKLLASVILICLPLIEYIFVPTMCSTDSMSQKMCFGRMSLSLWC